MLTEQERAAKRIKVTLAEGKTVVAYLVHRGAQHSRVAIDSESSKGLEDQIDKAGTMLVDNDAIEGMGSQIEPGHQRGGVPAEVRAHELTRNPEATYQGRDEQGRSHVAVTDQNPRAGVSGAREVIEDKPSQAAPATK